MQSLSMNIKMRQKHILFSVALILFLRAVWLLSLIGNKGVDIPYFDQFDLIAGLANTNALEQFNYLYYPHRQGLAYVIWGLIHNGVTKSFLIPSYLSWFGMVFTTFLSLWLIKRLGLVTNNR